MEFIMKTVCNSELLADANSNVEPTEELDSEKHKAYRSGPGISLAIRHNVNNVCLWFSLFPNWISS